MRPDGGANSAMSAPHLLHSPSLPYRGRPQRADARRLILVLGGVAPPGSLVHPVEEMTLFSMVLLDVAGDGGPVTERRAALWLVACVRPGAGHPFR